MNSADSLKYIADKLANWYTVNKRDLPWRDISDPYRIWISEIILQQTRVNQGMDYYNRFIERFPTVVHLAESDEDAVLKYWQGLGYYTRARNLHKAAQQIISKQGGIFPSDYNEVLKLSGIGDYTAAAICSFAYNQPYAVVDGNVYRVLSRLFGIQTPIDSSAGKKEFKLLAQSLLSTSTPGLHNQALMEFGALQCIPANPDCIDCPLQSVCKAYGMNQVTLFPVKSQKTKVTNRFFNYLFIRFQDKTYLQRRVARDVWQNLFEFPLIESDRLLSASELIENDSFKSIFFDTGEVEIYKISNPMKHVLSHRVIFAQFISINIANENEMLKQFVQVPFNEIDHYAVSRLMELFLENGDH
ncbi:MAG: A/G-specific adenine glycosylase [Bacteroidota bacterium]|nr:A/G-specific adenine glycosylase [Bacteroidota bacterium]